MFKNICVTNRNICRGNFLERIERIGRDGADMLILREKDLGEAEYELLARDVLAVCRKNNLPCVLHNYPGAARKIGHPALHLPMPLLRSLREEEKAFFKILGASCHSAEDAQEAEELGCTYITAGHIFETDCKQGLPGRGLEFLREVCRNVSLPVYAIGGIGPANMAFIREAGAAGACRMSYFMQLGCFSNREI